MKQHQTALAAVTVLALSGVWLMPEESNDLNRRSLRALSNDVAPISISIQVSFSPQAIQGFSQEEPLPMTRKVDSGWDETGQKLYQTYVDSHNQYVIPEDNDGVAEVRWQNCGQFYVFTEKGKNHTRHCVLLVYFVYLTK